MENLAYLHLAFAYEDDASSELVSVGSWLNKATAPDWNRFSSKAWKYLLPLFLTLSILSAVTSVLALEKGDQGPSVKNLQQRLKTAGFYQAPITQVYDVTTEEAVKRFQKAAGLPVNGVVGASTLQKLETWQPVKTTSTTNIPTNKTRTGTTVPTVSTTANQISTAATTTTTRVGTFNTITNKRKNPNYLSRGDEGEEVRILQERLRVAGFYYGSATGIYGPITEEAVKRFQAAYQLDADGIVGPATLAKLPSVGIGNGKDVVKKPLNRDQLKLGDRGEPVRILQTQLIKAKYLEGEPNGYYGSYTADAVSRFQKAQRLKVTGVADPATRSRLHSLVKTSPKSEFNVLEIQRRLQERGFYKGSLNGVMTEDTKQAIKQAQAFYGISLSDIRSGSF
ncbi:MAG TPA: peptidoglycan-binding protein [Nostocaceae cyanobacterium]|nr:peptidoglycan-binding protein [Nostocaceae cyanobacterium]